MPEPFLKSNNMFVDFTIPYASESNSYTQYDATTGDLLNCRFPQAGPMNVAIAGSYPSGTTITSNTYQGVALGQCSAPDASANPEIYKDIAAEFDVFNKLYINNIPSGLTSANLIPGNVGDTVQCSDTSLIPYVLEYTLVEDYSRFARFCMTASNKNKLSFANITDYKIFDYIDSATGSPCQSSTCNTNLAPFLGFNLNPQPDQTVIKTKLESSNKTITYILIAVIGILGLTLIGIIISYAMKVSKAKKL